MPYLPTIFGISIEVYFIVAILGIPTFFIWRWLFNKFIKVKRNRKIATWTATIVTTPILYMGLILLWIFSMSYHPTQTFDKEKWFTEREKRYELSTDIIESKMLINKTKAEVRQILGDEGNLDESDYWNYDLGFRPGIVNIDPDVLDIEFINQKVASVGQHET